MFHWCPRTDWYHSKTNFFLGHPVQYNTLTLIAPYLSKIAAPLAKILSMALLKYWIIIRVSLLTLLLAFNGTLFCTINMKVSFKKEKCASLWVAAWCSNVEGNASLQIWKEILRNPCDTSRNLNWQTGGDQVANWRRPKTGSCRATNEVEWVKPMSVAPSGVHYSKKHRLLMIAIEIFWVKCLQRKIPSSWGVRSPDPHRRVGRGTLLGFTILLLFDQI